MAGLGGGSKEMGFVGGKDGGGTSYLSSSLMIFYCHPRCRRYPRQPVCGSQTDYPPVNGAGCIYHATQIEIKIVVHFSAPLDSRYCSAGR